MASLKRSKTMPADGQTAKFLYTILKQLDLKSIDWNLVASQLEITNGHAARMRFSRFRQHMEGTPTNPRGSRQKKPRVEKATAQSKKHLLNEQKPESETPQIKREPVVKPEPVVDPLMSSSSPLANSGPCSPSPYSLQTVAPSDLTLHCPAPPQAFGYAMPPVGDNLVRIKTEPANSGPPVQEPVVKREPQTNNWSG